MEADRKLLYKFATFETFSTYQNVQTCRGQEPLIFWRHWYSDSELVEIM